MSSSRLPAFGVIRPSVPYTRHLPWPTVEPPTIEAEHTTSPRRYPRRRAQRTGRRTLAGGSDRRRPAERPEVARRPERRPAHPRPGLLVAHLGPGRAAARPPRDRAGGVRPARARAFDQAVVGLRVRAHGRRRRCGDPRDGPQAPGRGRPLLGRERRPRARRAPPSSRVRGDPAGRWLLLDAGSVRLAYREAGALPAGVRRDPGRDIRVRDPRAHRPGAYAGDRVGRPFAGPGRRTREGPPTPRAREPPEDPPRLVGAGHGPAAAPGPRADARPGGPDARRRIPPGGSRASEGRRRAPRPGDRVADNVRVDRGDPRPAAPAPRSRGPAHRPVRSRPPNVCGRRP